MIVPYFSVWDKKTRSFGQLFPSATIGSAERAFQESLKESESMAAKYPADFSLFHLFDFDDEQGLVVNRYEPPQLIVEATAFFP